MGARYADKPTDAVRTWIDAPPRGWALVSDLEPLPSPNPWRGNGSSFAPQGKERDRAEGNGDRDLHC
jgi:hypothetical protein